MSSPFPGMDPYLEDPRYWAEFHSRLIVAIADELAPSLLPKYYIGVETRTYQDYGEGSVLVGIPDAVVMSAREARVEHKGLETSSQTTMATIRPQQVTLPVLEEIRERYLEIREVGTNTVITVVEVLSPKNKRAGDGRSAYVRKRQAILQSASHFVEIDLLRKGEPMAMQGAQATDYRSLVSRADSRPKADLYGFTLEQPIPDFPLPLKERGEVAWVRLQAIVDGIYQRGGYELRLDYSEKKTEEIP